MKQNWTSGILHKSSISLRRNWGPVQDSGCCSSNKEFLHQRLHYVDVKTDIAVVIIYLPKNLDIVLCLSHSARNFLDFLRTRVIDSLVISVSPFSAKVKL